MSREQEVERLAQELMVTRGLGEQAARSEAELLLGAERKPAAKSRSKPVPSRQISKPRRELTDEQRRRAAERFVWREGDIKILKRGKH